MVKLVNGASKFENLLQTPIRGTATDLKEPDEEASHEASSYILSAGGREAPRGALPALSSSTIGGNS